MKIFFMIFCFCFSLINAPNNSDSDRESFSSESRRPSNYGAPLNYRAPSNVQDASSDSSNTDASSDSSNTDDVTSQNDIPDADDVSNANDADNGSNNGSNNGSDSEQPATQTSFIRPDAKNKLNLGEFYKKYNQAMAATTKEMFNEVFQNQFQIFCEKYLTQSNEIIELQEKLKQLEPWCNLKNNWQKIAAAAILTTSVIALAASIGFYAITSPQKAEKTPFSNGIGVKIFQNQLIQAQNSSKVLTTLLFYSQNPTLNLNSTFITTTPEISDLQYQQFFSPNGCLWLTNGIRQTQLNLQISYKLNAQYSTISCIKNYDPIRDIGPFLSTSSIYMSYGATFLDIIRVIYNIESEDQLTSAPNATQIVQTQSPFSNVTNATNATKAPTTTVVQTQTPFSNNTQLTSTTLNPSANPITTNTPAFTNNPKNNTKTLKESTSYSESISRSKISISRSNSISTSYNLRGCPYTDSSGISYTGSCSNKNSCTFTNSLPGSFSSTATCTGSAQFCQENGFCIFYQTLKEAADTFSCSPVYSNNCGTYCDYESQYSGINSTNKIKCFGTTNFCKLFPQCVITF